MIMGLVFKSSNEIHLQIFDFRFSVSLKLTLDVTAKFSVAVVLRMLLAMVLTFDSLRKLLGPCYFVEPTSPYFWVYSYPVLYRAL